jgi:hypothetical protein
MEGIKREIKKFLETNENDNTTKSVGYGKSSTEREVYTNKCIHQKA